jgi:hypothetical protein
MPPTAQNFQEKKRVWPIQEKDSLFLVFYSKGNYFWISPPDQAEVS